MWQSCQKMSLPQSPRLSHQQLRLPFVERRLFGPLPGEAPISVKIKTSIDTHTHICTHTGADAQREHQHSEVIDALLSTSLCAISFRGEEMLQNGRFSFCVKKQNFQSNMLWWMACMNIGSNVHSRQIWLQQCASLKGDEMNACQASWQARWNN